MNTSRRNHLIAMLATLLFHAAVVAVLLVMCLRYSPMQEASRTWPPVDSSEVLFGGEFVITGDSPDIAQNSSETPAEAASEQTPPPPVAESRVNTGKPADKPSPVVTSSRPSPAKVIKEEAPAEPTGPSKAEIEAAERAKREQEARQRIAGKVQFGKSGTGGGGDGKTGSPDGNSDTGVSSGTPGFNLKGRSLASWHTPARGPLGTITIRVTVNRQGQVTEASYLSGTGAAATSTASRQSCIAAARASRFSVDTDAPASQIGSITYHFR